MILEEYEDADAEQEEEGERGQPKAVPSAREAKQRRQLQHR